VVLTSITTELIFLYYAIIVPSIHFEEKKFRKLEILEIVKEKESPETLTHSGL